MVGLRGEPLKTSFPETNCEGSLILQEKTSRLRLLRSGTGGGIGCVDGEPRTGLVVRVSEDEGVHWDDTLVWAAPADYSSLQAMQSGDVGVLHTRNAI